MMCLNIGSGIKEGFMRIDRDSVLCIVGPAVLIIGFAILFIVIAITPSAEEKLYNGGVHAGCGGHWHFSEMSKLTHPWKLSGNIYKYECDKCGVTFESNTPMEGGEK
jgi:hypothetical protein